MTIGERLLNLRKEKNLSQEELANILDVSRQTISKWETDQSTPDFDKIVPLCNYFGITTDELLTGKSNIIESNNDDRKKTFARNIAIAVCMYILSIVAIIGFALMEKAEIGVCIFFVIIALATALLVYNGITNSTKEKIQETKDEKEERLVKEIVEIIGVVVYFLVSFLTMAWHLTWIIFLIVGLVDAIISLIFSLKDNKKEGKE
jgi:transcriptional regulator with XRE-family HTH domain